ncbi:hypothetical protein Trydic_g23074 [Trypoxylus dichotomus]
MGFLILLVWLKKNGSYVCLIDKTVIVTGANTGIGYYAALDFATRGARVILACRNEYKAQNAQKRIVKITKNPNVVYKLVDMTCLSSVRAFAKEINETEERIDILVNNAGAAGLGNHLTKDELQITLQVNHISPFLLTHLLIGKIKKSAPSRIVNVSSIMANFSNLQIDKINKYPTTISRTRADQLMYANTKLANILFTLELATKLKETGVTVNVLHPGAVNTEIFRRVQGVYKIATNMLANLYFRTAEEGAQTTIYLAISEKVEGVTGKLFENCSEIDLYRKARDPELAKTLWEVSQELAKLTEDEKIRIRRNGSYTCLVGKTAIVTGSNTGIGYITALDFASRGARVILACRNEDKAKDAQRKIIKETNNPYVVYKLVDMTSLESVRAFAKEINETEERVDILVNNAGAGGLGNHKTSDELQITLQVNHISGFLLTHLLLDKMKKSTPSRIINVASLAAKWSKLNLDKINEFPTDINPAWGDTQMYANSKLCNILCTTELAAKLDPTKITVNALHPGAVHTDIFRRMQGIIRVIFLPIIKLYFKTSEEGAQTTIYVAVSNELQGVSGKLFDNCKQIKLYAKAQNPDLAKKVWAKCEELAKLRNNEKIR